MAGKSTVWTYVSLQDPTRTELPLLHPHSPLPVWPKEVRPALFRMFLPGFESSEADIRDGSSARVMRKVAHPERVATTECTGPSRVTHSTVSFLVSSAISFQTVCRLDSHDVVNQISSLEYLSLALCTRTQLLLTPLFPSRHRLNLSNSRAFTFQDILFLMKGHEGSGPGPECVHTAQKTLVRYG